MSEILPTALRVTHGAEQNLQRAFQGSAALRHSTLLNSKLCHVSSLFPGAGRAFCLSPGGRVAGAEGKTTNLQTLRPRDAPAAFGAAQGVAESLPCKAGRDPAKSPHPFHFFLPFYTYHRLSNEIFANKLSSASKPLLIFAPFQGWVFNVVPWLVAIPTSLFSGFLSDHLINQGKSSFGFSSLYFM